MIKFSSYEQLKVNDVILQIDVVGIKEINNTDVGVYRNSVIW